jgi:NADH:ubiquinone oxidoreductase subunit 6 (subunit J)
LFAFFFITLLTLITAAVAMALRNLIHSALLLIGSWAGIAAFYLWAGAEFVAFAQVLVYVGAISMVVLFAVLLTRHSRADLVPAPDSIARAVGALLVGGAVLGVLWGSILGSNSIDRPARSDVTTVRDVGVQLMSQHAAALLVVGLLLTVALLGAIVIASNERPERRPAKP